MIRDINKDKIKVLFVDDEESNLRSFKAMFRRSYQVFTAQTATEALGILDENPGMHVVLSDQRMPQTTGIEFLEQVRTEVPDAVRILVTGYSDINAVIGAINKAEIYRFIAKPWNEDEIKDAIEGAYKQYIEKKAQKQKTEELIRTNQQLEFMLRQKLVS